MTLENAIDLCSDGNLIISPYLEKFVSNLTTEQRGVLAAAYADHQEHLQAVALAINEGRTKDPAMWQLILVLMTLSRSGDPAFSGAHYLGRRPISAEWPADVELPWLPDQYARYLPLFQAVYFAESRDRDVYDFIPEDWWGLKKTPQNVLDELGDLWIGLSKRGMKFEGHVTLKVTMLLDAIPG